VPLYECRDKNGWTALTFAAARGHWHVVEYLAAMFVLRGLYCMGSCVAEEELAVEELALSPDVLSVFHAVL
jgi:hypothetical protein